MGSGSNIDAVAHALRRQLARSSRSASCRCPPRSSESLRDFGSLENLERHFDSIDEVLIADPDFPQDEAVDLVDRCHRHGVRVRVAPSTMEILMDRVEFVPGQSLPLFELKPPVFEGVDFVIKRSFDFVGSVLLLIAAVAGAGWLIAIAIKLDSRGPVLFRSPRPGHRRQAVPVPEVPHDAPRRRGAAGRARGAQRDGGRDLQDPRGPAGHARRRVPAPLVARRAARSC